MHQSSQLERSQLFSPPPLVPALKALEIGFNDFMRDKQDMQTFEGLLKTYAGRPTALTYAASLSKIWGAEVYLKREDLLHGGAHKLNNALGQCYLAKRMGFSHIIAETGAGQHGVAAAMAAAKLGLKCTVYQGATDIARQQLNAQRMRLFGAQIVPVTEGTGTLKEAVSAAMRAWVANYKTSAYCLGSVVGPHPFPTVTRSFQRIIGDESRLQMLHEAGGLPHAVVACVGGGSNAAGVFSGFHNDSTVTLIGCEAAGAASLTHGKMGLLHGMESLILMDDDRQILETHSISAGLDYPGVGPWLAGLKLEGRLQSLPITDAMCITALKELAEHEGILCALETAHAFAGAKQFAHENPNTKLLICVSGRGDKDLESIAKYGAHK